MIYNELKQHGTEDFPFELYRVNTLHPKYEMAFHWHAAVELIRVLKGELTLTLDNRVHLLTAGEIAIVNSETVHGATPKNCEYECLVFHLAFLKTSNALCDRFLDDLLTHTAYLTEFPTEPSVVSLLTTIFDEIGNPQKGMHFKVIGYFHELLGELQRNGLYTAALSLESVRDEQKVQKLKCALKYLREHFSEDISLEDIAAASELSSKYFCKFFKTMTGTTPVRYLLSYRIERAARKLLSTDLTVTRIAEECGFRDLSYFIKTFKTCKGVPPNEYRKR